MTYQEMQKLDFIRKTDARTERRLRRIGAKTKTTSQDQIRRAAQWAQTEKQLRALLRQTKKTYASILTARKITTAPAADITTSSVRNTDIDRRLKRLKFLVERQKKGGEKTK